MKCPKCGIENISRDADGRMLAALSCAKCGADFDTGGLVKKAKSMIPLLIPLFVSAFRRADDLALAMESRCYRGGDGRTHMKTLVLSRLDLIAVAVLLFFAGVTLFLPDILTTIPTS